MLKSIIIVGIGSFFGGVLRFIISSLMKNIYTNSFPWGTLIVNLLGCLFIGLIYGLFSKHNTTSPTLCLLLTTGFCGGFTTFSTFANEGLQMLHSGDIWGFIAYSSISLFAGILLVGLGYWIIK